MAFWYIIVTIDATHISKNKELESTIRLNAKYIFTARWQQFLHIVPLMAQIKEAYFQVSVIFWCLDMAWVCVFFLLFFYLTYCNRANNCLITQKIKITSDLFLTKLAIV